MLENLTAGQDVRCTIEGEPRVPAARETILRLMRRDPRIKRALRRSQELRRKRMHSYIRGGRTWYSRERCAKVASIRAGETWTMPYTPDIAPDLRAVEKYIRVESA